MQTLEIISVNLWQILISLANLLIIFLILKKFLYHLSSLQLLLFVNYSLPSSGLANSRIRAPTRP